MDFIITNNNPDLLRAHIDGGGNVNKLLPINGCYPLYFACYLGATECVEILIAAGANINSRDGLNRTPLHTALNYSSKQAPMLTPPRAATGLRCTPRATGTTSKQYGYYSRREQTLLPWMTKGPFLKIYQLTQALQN